MGPIVILAAGGSVAVLDITRSSVGGQSISVLLTNTGSASSTACTAPERLACGASSVAVVGAGAEGLLTLVVLGESVLDEGGKKEEDTERC